MMRLYRFLFGRRADRVRFNPKPGPQERARQRFNIQLRTAQIRAELGLPPRS